MNSRKDTGLRHSVNTVLQGMGSLVSGLLATALAVGAGSNAPLVSEEFVPVEKGPEMVKISGGSFRMGCVSGQVCIRDERPVHEVTVETFELSKFEVTFEEDDRFTAATGLGSGGRRGLGPAAGDQTVVDRRGGVYEVAVGTDGEALPAADGGGVGVCGTSGDGDEVQLGERFGLESGQLQWLRQSVGQETDGAGGIVRTQQMGSSGHARERVGVGAGLLVRELLECSGGRLGLGGRRLYPARVARRLLVQRTLGPALRVPRRGRRGGPGAGKMYWTDWVRRKIQRANLDGSGVEDLVTSGLESPAALALDPVGN